MTRIINIDPLIEGNEREYYDSGIPSTVAVLGHPLHPLLIVFPVAFLVTVLLTDAVFWFTKYSFWAQASYWLLIGGLVTGVVAAITGLLDFVRIYRAREHKAGWIHLIGNVIVLVLSGINLLIRWNNIADAISPWGLILSLTVATLLGVTGWYGGELVYRHKIAVVGDSSTTEP